jgi:predicted peptidase
MRKGLRWLLGLMTLGLLSGPGRAAEAGHGFLDRVYKDADGNETKYALFVPHDYEGDEPYPLILFLHGSGERGADGKKPTEVGLGPAVRKREKTFPAFVLFPQYRQFTWSPDSDDARRALGMLARVQKEYKIDPARVYLTGVSMGGFGTWHLAAKYPDWWAAIVPVCGGGDAKAAPAIKDIPCWIFHGAKDPTVPVGLSRQMFEALKAAGGKPKYTEYPDVAHDSWDPAYATDELYDWLFRQHE